MARRAPSAPRVIKSNGGGEARQVWGCGRGLSARRRQTDPASLLSRKARLPADLSARLGVVLKTARSSSGELESKYLQPSRMLFPTLSRPCGLTVHRNNCAWRETG